MNQSILLMLIDLVASLIVEGVILSMLFNWIANKETEKQQQNLQKEMANIEIQNKFIYEQLVSEMRSIKMDVMNQIKESAKKNN